MLGHNLSEMYWATWVIVATSLVALHGSAFVIPDEEKDASPHEQTVDAFSKHWQDKLGDTQNTYKEHEIESLDLGKVMSVLDQNRESKEKIYNAEFGVDPGNMTDRHKELTSKEDRLREKYGEEYLDKEENLLNDGDDVHVGHSKEKHAKQDGSKDVNLEDIVDEQENELDGDVLNEEHEEDDIEKEEHAKEEILKEEANAREANSEEQRAKEIANEYSVPHMEENNPKEENVMNEKNETESGGLETGVEKALINPTELAYADEDGLELSSPEFDEDRARDEDEDDDDDKREVTADVGSKSAVDTPVATSKNEESEKYDEEIIELVELTPVNAKDEQSDQQNGDEKEGMEAEGPIVYVKEEVKQGNKPDVEGNTTRSKATDPSEIFEELMELVTFPFDNAAAEKSEQKTENEENEAKEEVSGNEKTKQENKADGEGSTTRSKGTEPSGIFGKEVIEAVEYTFDNAAAEKSEQNTENEENEAKEEVDGTEKTKQENKADGEGRTTRSKSTDPSEIFGKEVIEVVEYTFDNAAAEKSEQNTENEENEAKEEVDGNEKTKQEDKADGEGSTARSKATDPNGILGKEVIEVVKYTFDDAAEETSEQQNGKDEKKAKEEVGVKEPKQENESNAEGSTRATEPTEIYEEEIIKIPVKLSFSNDKEEQSDQKKGKEKEAKTEAEGSIVEGREEAKQEMKTAVESNATLNKATEPSANYAEDIIGIGPLAFGNAGAKTSDEQNEEGEKEAKDDVGGKEEVQNDVKDNTTLDKAAETSVATEVEEVEEDLNELLSDLEEEVKPASAVNGLRHAREARYSSPWSKSMYPPGWGESHISVERFSQPGWNVNMVTANERPLSKQMSNPSLAPLPINRSWSSSPYRTQYEKNVPAYRFQNGKFVQTIYASPSVLEKAFDQEKPTNIQSRQDEQGLSTSHKNATGKISPSSKGSESPNTNTYTTDLDQNLEAQPSNYYQFSVPRDESGRSAYFDPASLANPSPSYPGAPIIVPVPVFYPVLPIPVPYLIPVPGLQSGLPPPPQPRPSSRPCSSPYDNNDFQPLW